MPATVETFRCMACGHEFRERVEPDEAKERSCPKCRSNSIRYLKPKPGAATVGKAPAQA